MKLRAKKTKATLFFLLFCGIIIFTISIGGCRWASPPPRTEFQNLEELKNSLADENMWFFDVDLGVDDIDFEKEDYYARVEEVSGGGCTKEIEHFNYYTVRKDLRKGDAYLNYIIEGYSSFRNVDFFEEEYNFNGISGFTTCEVNNRMDNEDYGDYECEFYFSFVINDKTYSIIVEQYTWKTLEDKAEAEDSVFGKIITEEVFLEMVETAITNRFQ